jgi:crotonobetainyl-CoA:carnitine CoA-transferase CaiB-like acyl-CoA transferase
VGPCRDDLRRRRVRADRRPLPGIPVKLSASPGSVRKAPPLVGEDTEDVYRELLGLDEEEIAQLREAGAL